MQTGMRKTATCSILPPQGAGDASQSRLAANNHYSCETSVNSNSSSHAFEILYKVTRKLA